MMHKSLFISLSKKFIGGKNMVKCPNCGQEDLKANMDWKDSPKSDQHGVHWEGECPECGRKFAENFKVESLMDKEEGEPIIKY